MKRVHKRGDNATKPSGGMIMTAKICCIVVAVAALPFLFAANTGCGFHSDKDSTLGDNQPNSYVCSCTCSPGAQQQKLHVVASEDDAEQRLDNNTVDINSNDLDLAPLQVVGVRFRDVNIPAGVTIVSANLQFTASSSSSGSVSFVVAGQAADDAPPFVEVINNLTTRIKTSSTVPWSPLAWTAGDAGADQRTPDLAAILQEIVDRPNWAEGHALALLISTVSTTNARHAVSFDTNAARAPVLEVTFDEPAAPVVGPLDLPVCVLPVDNPNTGGGVPNAEELMSDCSNRVQHTLSGLARACNYPSGCSCTLQANSTRFADKCDTDCTANPVAADCSNFDPKNNNITATNATGDAAVCLANSPLAAALYGRRTTCQVAGTVQVDVDDHHPTSDATGVVQFLGGPCPGQSCAVGMEYRLDIDDIEVGNFFHSETFKELAGLGETGPGGQAMIDPGGTGTFLANSTAVSAQGRRGSDRKSLATTNEDAIDVEVHWDATCHLEGTLVGSVDPEAKRCEAASPNGAIDCEEDADCGGDVDECSGRECNCEPVPESDLALSLELDGDIMNEPPTADAGPDQTVECDAGGVSQVALNGAASSDPDDDIVLFNWFRGSRTGDGIGSHPTTTVPQTKGVQTYVLRVIDSFAQADEDTTTANVVDTTPPVLTCSVSKSILTPFDNNLVNVGLSASAVDQCEGELPVGVSVFSDEDDEELSSPPPLQNPPHDLGPPFSPDAKDIAVGTLRLRQERRANRDGRVYLIVVDATDTDGNRGVDCCTAVVPLANSNAAKASAQAQADAAESFCLAHDGAPPAGYAIVGNGAVIGPKQ